MNMSKVKKFQQGGSSPTPTKTAYGVYQGMNIDDDVINDFGRYAHEWMSQPGNVNRWDRSKLEQSLITLGEGVKQGQVPEFSLTGETVTKGVNNLTGSEELARKNILGDFADNEIGNIAYGLFNEYMGKRKQSSGISSSTPAEKSYWWLSGAKKAVAKEVYGDDESAFDTDNWVNRSVEDRKKQIATSLIPALEKAKNYSETSEADTGQEGIFDNFRNLVKSGEYDNIIGKLKSGDLDSVRDSLNKLGWSQDIDELLGVREKTQEEINAETAAKDADGNGVPDDKENIHPWMKDVSFFAEESKDEQGNYIPLTGLRTVYDDNGKLQIRTKDNQIVNVPLFVSDPYGENHGKSFDIDAEGNTVFRDTFKPEELSNGAYNLFTNLKTFASKQNESYVKSNPNNTFGGLFEKYTTGNVQVPYKELTAKYPELPKGYKVYTYAAKGNNDIFGSAKENNVAVFNEKNELVGKGVVKTNKTGDIINQSVEFNNTGDFKGAKQTSGTFNLGRLRNAPLDATTTWAGEKGNRFWNNTFSQQQLNEFRGKDNITDESDAQNVISEVLTSSDLLNDDIETRKEAMEQVVTAFRLYPHLFDKLSEKSKEYFWNNINAVATGKKGEYKIDIPKVDDSSIWTDILSTSAAYKEGGKIIKAQLGTQFIDKKSSKKINDYKASKYSQHGRSFKSMGKYGMSGYDVADVASTSLDAIGTAASFVPGVGTAIAIGTGLASTAIDAVSGYQRDGWDGDDTLRLGMNLAFTGLSAIPGGGLLKATKAAKLAKLEKVANAVGKTVDTSKMVGKINPKAVVSLGDEVLEAATKNSDEAVKVLTKSADDLKNIEKGFNALDPKEVAKWSKAKKAVVNATNQADEAKMLLSEAKTIKAELAGNKIIQGTKDAIIAINPVTKYAKPALIGYTAVNAIDPITKIASGRINELTTGDTSILAGTAVSAKHMRDGFAMRYGTTKTNKTVVSQDAEVKVKINGEEHVVPGANAKKILDLPKSKQKDALLEDYKVKRTEELKKAGKTDEEISTELNAITVDKVRFNPLANRVSRTKEKSSEVETGRVLKDDSDKSKYVPKWAHNSAKRIAAKKGIQEKEYSLPELNKMKYEFPDKYRQIIKTHNKVAAKYKNENKNINNSDVETKNYNPNNPSTTRTNKIDKDKIKSFEKKKLKHNIKSKSKDMNENENISENKLKKPLTKKINSKGKFQFGGVIKAQNGLMFAKPLDYSDDDLKTLIPAAYNGKTSQQELNELNEIHRLSKGAASGEVGVRDFQDFYGRSPLTKNLIEHVAKQYPTTAVGDYSKLGAAYNYDNKRGGVTKSWMSATSRLSGKINDDTASNIMYDAATDSFKFKPNNSSTPTAQSTVPTTETKPLVVGGKTIGADTNVKPTVKERGKFSLPDPTDAIRLQMALGTNRKNLAEYKKIQPTLGVAPEFHRMTRWGTVEAQPYMTQATNLIQQSGKLSKGISDQNAKLATQLEGGEKSKQLISQGRMVGNQVFSDTAEQATQQEKENILFRTDVLNKNKAARNAINTNNIMASISKNIQDNASWNQFLIEGKEERKQYGLQKDYWQKQGDLVKLKRGLDSKDDLLKNQTGWTKYETDTDSDEYAQHKASGSTVPWKESKLYNDVYLPKRKQALKSYEEAQKKLYYEVQDEEMNLRRPYDARNIGTFNTPSWLPNYVTGAETRYKYAGGGKLSAKDRILIDNNKNFNKYFENAQKAFDKAMERVDKKVDKSLDRISKTSQMLIKNAIEWK